MSTEGSHQTIRSNVLAEVADGVFRLGTKWINFYLIEDRGEFTVIDAGYPGYWKYLVQAMDALGKSLSDIRAVILTHHHVDHVGTAGRLAATSDVRVFVGAGDAWIVGGKYPSHANSGFYRQSLWRPSGIRFIAHSAAAGAGKYHRVQGVEVVGSDPVLDVPGRPRVIATPGHTGGHCSVALEKRGVLFSGDAMANFDYVSGKPGLGLHRLNDDREVALASLERLDPIDAGIVLFGHGDPWTEGLGGALETVRLSAQNSWSRPGPAPSKTDKERRP